MKKSIFLLPFILFAFVARAQYPPLAWAKKIEAVDHTNAFSSVIAKTADEQGNIYSFGSFRDSLRPDQNQPNYYVVGNENWESGVFSKYAPNGNLLWASKIEARVGYFYVNDLSIDQDHNIYVLCNAVYTDTIDFDPSPGKSNTVSDGNDFFFAKYNSTGNLLWVKRLNVYNSTNAFTNIPACLKVDNNKNIYIGGQYQYMLDIDPDAPIVNLSNPSGINCNCTVGFYAKYDSLGTLMWYQVDANNAGINAIDVNETNGNIAIGARPSQFYGNGLRVCNAAGNSLKYISASGISVQAVKYDTNGNLFFSGTFWDGGNDFDWGSGSFMMSTPHSYETVGFAGKYNDSLNFQWALSYEATNDPAYRATVYSLTIDADQNPILAYAESNGNGYVKGFYKIDGAAGTALWSNSQFSVLVGLAGVAAVPSAFDGSVIFSAGAGFSSNAIVTIDADPSPALTTNLTGKGYWSMVAKYGACSNPPVLTGLIAGQNSLCSSDTLTYSIAPQVGISSYAWTLPSGWIGTSTSNSIQVQPSIPGGTISVTATNLCGLSNALSLAVSVNAVPTVSVKDTIICAGQSATLYASGASSYVWDSTVMSSSLNTALVNPTTTTSYSVTGSTGGCSASASALVIVNPAYSAAVSAAICQGDLYVFPDSTTSAVASVHTSHFSSISACDSSIVTTLTVNPLPIVTLNLAAIDTLCLNQGIVYLVGENPSGGIYSGTGVASNMFNTALAGLGTQTIFYTYSDANLCSNSATAILFVDACSGIFDMQHADEISIYPNPSTGNFKLISSSENQELTITDGLGQVILNKQIETNETKISLSHSGVYFLFLKSKNGITTQKIIVNP